MTPQKTPQRETIDLLERILERVESIDKNVEDLLDQVGEGFGQFRYSGNYDDRNHNDAYD